jgi:hypothetical protein
MKLASAVSALFLVVLVSGGNAFAADPIYLDQLMESPLASLQQQFPGLRKEGCYRIGVDRYLLMDIDKKDQKPWRVVISSLLPCRRAEDIPAIDVRERVGAELGQKTPETLQKLGRPDAAAAPDTAMKRLGDIEYFYICRVSEGCARHMSIYARDGVVTAIAEWYSE